jgi:diguanylate cyclase (GGDEF)-like protein
MYLRFVDFLRAIVSLRHYDLEFPPKAGDAFEQEYREKRIAHIRSSMLFSIPLYNAFLVVDYLCLPQSFGLCLAVRLGIVTPFALVCFAALSRVSRQSREFLIAFVPLPSLASMIVLYNTRIDLIALGQIALILIMLYSIYAMWPDFRYACATILAAVLGDSLFLMNCRALDFAQTTSFISLLWTAGFLSLHTCYSMERQMRISYQLRLQLSTQNTELVRISNIDSLTGIPNRRYFDSELRVQWKECLQSKQSISVLMIDLDHFKHLNDQHGHVYGDKILNLVANTLRQALRDKQDKVARYGGEEFVVILPSRPLSSAIVIAQRLCAAVRAAAFPPDNSGFPVNITVSIGVASVCPNSGSGSTRLLRTADMALYKAKANGRDRIWPETETSA